MDVFNIEIKAHCKDLSPVRRILEEKGALFAGKDHQVDTYFDVPHGRLKLRQGNIENSLIFYDRTEVKGLKKCNCLGTRKFLS